MNVQTPARPVARARHRPRAGLVALVWIGVPVVWLLWTGVIGTHLDPSLAAYATPGLFLALLLGLPFTILWLSRALLGSRSPADHHAIQVRRPTLRQMRAPEVIAAPRSPRVAIGARRRAAALGVLAMMFTTSLSLWTAIPLGWVWIGSQLAASRRPEMGPYLVIIVGIPVTMSLFVRALYRLDAVYARLTRRQGSGRARAAWLKSLGSERQHRPTSTADTTMLVSVIVAVLCLLVWFLVFAELHPYGEWYMD